MLFKNANQRSVTLFAGHPKKQRPSVRRVLKPGQSTTFRTKLRRLQYVVARRDSNGELTLVDFGSLNTRNGRQRVITPEDFSRTARTSPTSGSSWLTRTIRGATSPRTIAG